MPYVTTDYSFDLTGAGKLRVFKGLMRPSQMGSQWHFLHNINLLLFALLDWHTMPNQSVLAFECRALRLSWTFFFMSSFTLTAQPASQTLQEEKAAFLLPAWKPRAFSPRLTTSYCTYTSWRCEGVSVFSVTWTIISHFVLKALVWCLFFFLSSAFQSYKWKQKPARY